MFPVVMPGVHSKNENIKDAENLDLINLAFTPINLSALRRLVTGYKHKDAKVLLNGFLYGFNMHYSGPRLGRECKNLRSALSNPNVVQAKINKEINARRMAGPFVDKPMPNLIVSPIGLVPKKIKGEFRLIHHLSFPEGESVNDYIDKKFCSVSYTNFDEAVAMIQNLGRHCYLFKMDLKNAFRLLPIRPEDFEVLGLKFKSLYYIDKALPFGASVSCKTFEKFSTFLEYVVKQRLTSGGLIHYLDDFLGADRSFTLCRAAMDIFKTCMDDLNVPLADEKTEGPNKIMVFLGIELDTDKMQIRIPIEKITEVITKVREILNKKKASLREIQSLIGSLNFCCRAIPAGRPFCRRLINATCGVSKSFHRLRVNTGIKRDLRMWLSFFENHNGISAFHDRFWVSNEEVQLYTDSAGGLGCGFGIFYCNHWCQAKWPKAWHERNITSNITVLELFPIWIAINIWGKELMNKKIKFYCDNEAVVHILNTLTSKSELVMCIVRALTLKCLKFNILLKAKHIPGSRNEICDALSRFQATKFRELAPEADLCPVVVPQSLWNIFNEQQ
ncbi:uncharacterized protein LOC132722259 isoform X1 [Ruditapes philippinarum]|uniref:uncharacterized protein LOC132722259 isoform X1 n=1 Tax=Ruditapes philippinarum TaxID=129788 RepID=UPI00295C1741|nr:uncharacterized protein LOC132722259 isoform X1 [Ruditapes philippinarum]